MYWRTRESALHWGNSLDAIQYEDEFRSHWNIYRQERTEQYISLPYPIPLLIFDRRRHSWYRFLSLPWALARQNIAPDLPATSGFTCHVTFDINKTRKFGRWVNHPLPVSEFPLRNFVVNNWLLPWSVSRPKKDLSTKLSFRYHKSRSEECERRRCGMEYSN